ncbi:MAG: DUF4157 domain-containing protein, partial [Kiloniellales bacterium]
KYADQVFSGEGKIAYALGRFNGWVLVRVDPKGKISGEGEAEFKLADWLTGKIGLFVHPDLNVDARGELVLPDEIELFKVWKYERNFFTFEQEFPLFGISVPVIGSIGIVAEVNASAGFRAAFGPGTLRNIKAVGDISTRPDAEPAFTISGDFNIPAGAEIVVVLGGGIGLSALVAKISGGLNIKGVAGVYGAITLTPTFAYVNGDYLLKGEALLEAAAQLRAGVGAYARLRVGIGWFSKQVWREDWTLAEWVFDPGWNMGLKASIDYTLGQPFTPEVKFDEVKVDPMALAKNAIPKSGEPVKAPKKEAKPKAKFTPAVGTVGNVQAGPGAAQPSRPGAVAPPGGARAAAAADRAAPGGGAGPPEEAPPPTFLPPAALAKKPEERSLDEAYIGHVYDRISKLFPRAKAATAPSDEALARRAVEELEEEPEGAAAAAPPAPERAPLEERPRTGGRPLPPRLKGSMEEILDADLSAVRLHTDEQAHKDAARIGAEAFAEGKHLSFAESRDPEAGHEDLLAHELVHVVQGAGDGSAEVSRPDDEVEKEAEEAAQAVRRGEKPKPVTRGRGRAGIHRAPKKTKGGRAAGGGAGRGVTAKSKGREKQRVDASAKREFTLARWKKLLSDPEVRKNKMVQETFKALYGEAEFDALMADQTYDDKSDTFRERAFVPMHFPDSGYLPHRSVMGNPQIKKGQILVRASGFREDTNQNKLSRLMYKPAPAATASKGVAKELKKFTKSPQGTITIPDRDKSWEDYQKNPFWKKKEEEGRLEKKHEFEVKQGQKSSQSEHNLSLTRRAFNRLWKAGVFYYHRTDRGIWRRDPRLDSEETEAAAEVAAGTTGGDAAAAAGGQSVDQLTRRRMVADFESHHVVPLWLQATDVASGDRLENLAPWHKSAHQSNHAAHHLASQAVARTTGVNDYRHFRPGTRFLISEFISGNTAHPAGSPAVQLARPKPGDENASGTEYVWVKRARPAWMG